MGVNQPPDSIHGMEETITPIIYGQSSCDTTSSVTDVQNRIMVTMLGDALQTVNAGMQDSDAVTRPNNSVIQSHLQNIQQLKSSNAEYVVLHQRIADLETQANQVQNLATAYQKQEAKSSDITTVMDAEHKTAKCKMKQSKKSVKKSCLVPSVSSPCQSSAESSDSDSDGNTEALLSTSSTSRWEAPSQAGLYLHLWLRRNHGQCGLPGSKQ